MDRFPGGLDDGAWLPGAFGRRVNAWYVWVPLCFLFIAPFLPWRRKRLEDGRRERRAWSLLHVDLLALLGLSISLALFNNAKIGLSTPADLPVHAVPARAHGAARVRPRPAAAAAALFVPMSWLAVGVIFLVGFRVGLNVVNSNVIDVGYAGVIGADKLIHDKPLYGNWPKDNASGDTYGTVAYYAYVPFRLIFGWSGTWDDLPAAHAAAIVFDLLTLLGLYWLGRRVRGPTLGVVLAYAWAAYPFTLWTLSSNTNDSLVSLLLVVALLVVTLRAGSRGRGRARRPDQVRAVRARAAAAARDRPAPGRRQVVRYVARVRADGRGRDAAGDARQQLARVLARHDRLPGRPHLPVLDLGSVGRPRGRAAPGPGRHRGVRARGDVRAPPARRESRSPRWGRRS